MKLNVSHTEHISASASHLANQSQGPHINVATTGCRPAFSCEVLLLPATLSSLILSWASLKVKTGRPAVHFHSRKQSATCPLRVTVVDLSAAQQLCRVHQQTREEPPAQPGIQGTPLWGPPDGPLDRSYMLTARESASFPKPASPSQYPAISSCCFFSLICHATPSFPIPSIR